MPERILPILDLIITGVISGILLVVSFGFIPILVAILNGIYIYSKIKSLVITKHNGSWKKYFLFIVKKNK